MPEFLHLLSPQSARELLFQNLAPSARTSERIETPEALDRVTAEDVIAPRPLPEFARSTVDGYAVSSADTYGATDSLPAYLRIGGEVRMGAVPDIAVAKGTCVLIHTGGMLPSGADAVVMLEHTQIARTETSTALEHSRTPASRPMQGTATEIEVLKAVAVGENVIQVAEDVRGGQVVIPAGRLLRPPEIGGLMALGLTSVAVVRRPRLGLISSGDEVVPPGQEPRPGQVRDVNAYTLAAAITKRGAIPASYGIVPDQPAQLMQASRRALLECEAVIITAGSSASIHDQTAAVVDALGQPGVLVHGVNTRPGKPTILGVCGGKAVLGLPGNPVSALVNAYLFVLPLVDRLLGLPADQPRPTVLARLDTNLASEAGREDWWPVRLRADESGPAGATAIPGSTSRWVANPIFGRSNLIFNLVAADGLLCIPPDVTGLASGAIAEVFLL